MRVYLSATDVGEKDSRTFRSVGEDWEQVVHTDGPPPPPKRSDFEAFKKQAPIHLYEEHEALARGCNAHVLLILGLVLLGVLLIVAMTSITASQPEEDNEPLFVALTFAIVCGSFAIIPVGILGARLMPSKRKRLRARWRSESGPHLGDFSVMIDRHPVFLGQSFDIRYEQEALRTMELTGGSVSMMVIESVRYGCGTDTCYQTELRPTGIEQPIDAQPLREGRTFQVDARLTLPVNAPPTQVYKNNRLGYALRVTLQFGRGLPDYTEDFRVQVVA